MKNTIVVLKIVFDFLSQLKEEQINDLVNNNARLALVYGESPIQKNTVNSEYVDEICKMIEEIDSREKASEYLLSLNINKSTLRAIVKKYDIPSNSKDTNETLINKIIDGVVGAKLRFNALLNTNLE